MNRNLIHKIEMETDKAEEKVKGIKRATKRTVNHWKFRAVAVLAGVIMAGVVLTIAFMNISAWYDQNRVFFQTPVVVRPPVIVQAREIAKPVEKKIPPVELAKIQRQALIERLYQATRFLESRVGFDTAGTAGYCQSIGEVNEVGYFPEGNKKFCFTDEAEQKLTLTRWFDKRIDKTMTANEALCLYVTGQRQPMCKRVMDIGL